MKLPLKYRLMLPLGLLLISASMIVAHFFKIEDSYRGGIIGIGIGLIIISMIKQRRLKHN